MALRLYLKTIHCSTETDEVGADEPFVLVTAVNLSGSVAGVTRPDFDVKLYGAFNDFDEDETKASGGVNDSFWGLRDTSAPLTDPDSAIFIAALMENDDGDPGALRSIVKGAVASSVLGSLGAPRHQKVASLIRDIEGSLRTPTGFPNIDDKVGAPQEIRFSAEALAGAEQARPAQVHMVFDGDGGNYVLVFEAFNDFGVFGAIRDKWMQLGAGGGPLGISVSDELPTFDGIGRFRNFGNGMISWHPDLGPSAVWGLIGVRWNQIGREQFGYPITDELDTSDRRGRFNHFRALHLAGQPEASIFWSPATGACEVYGAIRDFWGREGWESSRFGFPLSPEQDMPGGRQQRFERGTIGWTPGGGPFAM